MKLLVWGAALAIFAPQVATAGELDGLQHGLQSMSEPEAEEAAHQLAASKNDKALDVMVDALEHGTTPELAGVLLDGLGARHDRRAADVLARYAKNRNPELRQKAVRAAGALPAGDPNALSILLSALSDQEPAVRAEAAAALGRRHETAAVEKLLVLLRRGDQSAAPALAELATPELARRLADLIGEVPDGLLCSALGEILKRRDFGPDPIRVEVVRTLSKVPGADSTAALVEYLAATSKDKSRPSRLAAQQIVDQRSSQ